MKTKSLAIPIRIVDFSESSQIVHLFTRQHGAIEGIAKGAYREKSGFQGPFDLGTLYEVVFAVPRGAGLAVLTESTLVDGFRGLRRSWRRYVAACHVLEFLRTASIAWAPEPELFELAVEAFRALERAEDKRVNLEIARFDALALRVLGLLPPLSACVGCGRRWPGAGRSAFLSPEAGGILCGACRVASSRSAFRLSSRIVRALLSLSDFESSPEETAQAWEECGGKVQTVVGRLRDYLLEREFLALKVSGF